MNRLLTFPGLQPIYLGDFDFIQDSVKEAFLQLLKGLTGQDNPRCILKEATPDKDGVICIDGEILPLKYFSGGLLGGPADYKIESSYSGERTFKDGTIQKCHESRYAIGVAGLTGTSTFPKFQDLLTRFVKINQHPTWSNYGGNQILLQVYRSIVGNLYTFVGKFTIIQDCTLTSLAEEEILGDMPVGDYYFPITIRNGSILKTIPGKMSVTQDSDYRKGVITISATTFAKDDVGEFTFNTVNL